MKGSIYTTQKCFECGGTLKYVEGAGIMQCKDHPQLLWRNNCEVLFGEKHHKRFKTVREAERHLTGLRFQTDHGQYDDRDWQKGQPLSFQTQRENFVLSKKGDPIGAKQIRHIEMVLEKAGKQWDHMSIKDIGEGQIEDFLKGSHRMLVSKKNKAGDVVRKNGKAVMVDGPLIGNTTRAKWKTVLHDFWTWVVRREKRLSGLEMPEFPEMKFENAMKKIVNMDDQAAILDELQRITWDLNPRIWLGIRLMSWYPRVRPGEMLSLKEGHINLVENWILIPHPKEKNKPKFIHLLPEHAELIQEILDMQPKALPGMFFFRHLKTKSGVKAGVQFGPKYFNKWWKQACENIGINEVAVYAGVKHSTVTALGKILSPEQIQHDVTGHLSDAFKRYFLPDAARSMTASRHIAEMQNPGKTLVRFPGIKKSAK